MKLHDGVAAATECFKVSRLHVRILAGGMPVPKLWITMYIEGGLLS